MAKSITLLGSTGSIGTQSLDVARSQGYEVRALAANSSVDQLLEQIEEFHPRYVAVADSAACRKLKDALAGRANAPQVLEGAEGIVTLAGMGEADVVLNAVVGIAGLGATLAALESGIMSNPAWEGLTAVQQDRCYVLPKDLFHYKPNARWAESYAYMAKLLYPELAEDIDAIMA